MAKSKDNIFLTIPKDKKLIKIEYVDNCLFMKLKNRKVKK